jgi:hypothetical protein
VSADDLSHYMAAAGRLRDVEAERDRLRSALLDILVLTDPNDGVYVLADGALNAVPSELDDAVAHAELRAERDRLRAKLHELMARDVDVVDMMNIEYGCPDCGVHHACGEVVAERDRLRAVVVATLDGLTGPENEDAVAALTSEHVNALKAVRRFVVGGEVTDG